MTRKESPSFHTTRVFRPSSSTHMRVSFFFDLDRFAVTAGVAIRMINSATQLRTNIEDSDTSTS